MTFGDRTCDLSILHHHVFEDAEWYWGEISNEVTLSEMRPIIDPDIRSAVRGNGKNLLMKIYQCNGEYGFLEDGSLAHESVMDLVEFYKHFSLKIYNYSLDVKLLYPLSKYQDDIAASKKI